MCGQVSAIFVSLGNVICVSVGLMIGMKNRPDAWMVMMAIVGVRMVGRNGLDVDLSMFENRISAVSGL